MQDFAGAYGECMYLLDMAIRPEALPTDAVALAEMVLALKDMIFGKRSERLAVIVAEQLALELDDLAKRRCLTGRHPPQVAFCGQWVGASRELLSLRYPERFLLRLSR